MPSLTLDALRARLPGSQLDPLYLVLGDDERGKDEAVAAFVATVPEDVRGFALERVSALECEASAIVASARTPPFLGDRRVIIVTRAEKWLVGRRRRTEGDEGAGEEPAGDLGALETYFESPAPFSTLVVVAEDVNRTLKAVKLLLKQATTVECWGLKDEREARGPSIAEALERGGRLATAQLRKAGLAVDRRTLQPLLAHAGTDIGTLRGALDRLILYCHGRSEVTLEDVRTIVGGAALVDDWAMVNAIERGDAREALRQVRLLIDEGDGPYRTLGQLGWFVRSRLAPSLPLDRARQVVNAVFETDLAMKSSGGEPKVLLERLVMELCGVRGPGFAPGRGTYDARRQGSGR